MDFRYRYEFREKAMKPIQFCKPFIGKDEIRAVSDVIKSRWVVMGKKVEEFEKRFADFIGAPYAIATNSCTSALFLSLKALGIGTGIRVNSHVNDHVLVPSLTYTATAAVVVHAGARPVFGDVDIDTLCLDRVALESSSAFGAAIPVHLAGNRASFPFDPGYPIIEDSAHLIQKDQFRGRIQCFSFYGTKNITTAVGGMIALKNKKMYEWLKLARHDGIDKNTADRYRDGKYEYSVSFPGWNMDMNDIQAAMGIEQLKKIGEISRERRYIVDFYNEKLGGNHYGDHLYPIVVENRADFMDKMKAAGIQCSVHFLPLHKMPAYMEYVTLGNMENTEWLGERLVSLPLYPKLSYKDLRRIVSKVRRYAVWPEKLPLWAAGQ